MEPRGAFGYNVGMKNILDATITIILGGGQGSRLMPLTKVRSKPAVPFGGIYRIIDIPISNSINNDLSRIFVLTQFNSFSLNRHIHRTYTFDAFRRGFIEIIAAEQTNEGAQWFQGTADAVRRVLSHISVYEPKYVLILSGDQLYRMNLKEFVTQHASDKGRGVTVSCIPVDRRDASQFGLMRTAADGRITEFVEKPKDPAVLDALALPDGRLMASMGIYVFDYDVLVKLLAENKEKTDFGRDIIPASIRSHPVKAYKYEGYWEDIGTIRSFFNANLMMTSLKPPFDLYVENGEFFTRPRHLPPSKVHGCRVEQTLIGDGSIILAESVRESVIGIRSIIRAGTKLDRVVMMGSDFFEDVPTPGLPYVGIGRHCEIRNAILDKDVRIGSNVRLVNEKGLQEYEDDRLVIRDGIIVVPKRAVIPDGYSI